MEVIKEDTSQRLHHQHYANIVAGLGAIIWFGVIWFLPLPEGAITPIALIGFFFTFLTSFPLYIFDMRITLNQIVFLGAVLTYGPVTAAWSAVIGVGVGMFLQRAVSISGAANDVPKSNSILGLISRGFYEIGLLVTPLAVVTLIFGWEGYLSDNSMAAPGALALVYVLVHAALLLGTIWLQPRKEELRIRDFLLALVMMELLPLLFILISTIAYPSIKLASVGIFGGLPAMLSALLFVTMRSRAALVRRVRDLSLLNEISQVIRYSNSLDRLLTAIHVQTAKLLGVKNFYVAIYDHADKTLWYPFAIKNEEPQNWGRRPLMSRLTDRVIREKEAIMLPRDAHTALEKIGVPLGDEPLYSWLGVPLITPTRTIGCLAVFSLTPDITFTEEDLKLLTTLSGQVSIPLENALMIEQTGQTISRQTKQLSIMETIGQQLSASLQLDDVFESILDYALEFTHSPRGSLSNYDPVADAFVTKVHRGYGEDVSEITLMKRIPERAIRTGEAVMVNHLSNGPAEDGDADEQTRSKLTVPIINNEQVIGIIDLESTKPNEYTNNELDFVSQLADQAALAINNAALYEKAQRSLREQATLYMISSRLAVYNELGSVLNAVAQAFSAAMGSYLTGVYLWDESKQCYQCEAVMERAHEDMIELPPSISNEEWKEIKKQKKGNGPFHVTGEQKKLASILKLKKGSQSLVFPLQIADQHIGLVVNHLSATQSIKDSEMQFPQAIAAQSTIAVQNALLFSDVTKGLDRLETVLNAVGEGVLMVGADLRVTLANKSIEAITGLHVSEIAGRRLSELATDLRQPLGLSPEEVRNIGQDPTGEGGLGLPLRHSYGFQERFYERTIAPVWAANEQVLGWVIVVRDITEEERISQTRELLTETLVHDLRSPIGAIKTTLELIQEGLPESERDPVTEQSLDIARRSTDRVLTLINSLLDISQLESGKVDIKTKPGDIHVLIADVIGDLVQQANEDGVILRKAEGKDIPHVLMEENLIRRVVTNLLDNALNFTPEGGIVTVKTSQEEEGFVTIRVSDTGPGIPEDYREQVFTRFSQVPGWLGRRRGSGLGLTFCRLVVEAHDGRIWVEAGEKGSGATLAFTLPAKKPSKN
jgi:NtrC-family two-component system sensor histidine kinase KinB